MVRKSIDLILVMLIAVIAIGLTLSHVGNEIVRVVIGLPLVLILPGYALTAAMLSRHTIGTSLRAAFSLGLSLVVTVLGGLVLHWTPYGLRAETWAILLGGVTLGASLVALLRHSEHPTSTSGQPSLRIGLHQVVLFGSAVAVIIVAMAVTRIGESEQPRPGFTQLWITPADTATANTVRLGVDNFESKKMSFKLTVNSGTKLLGVWEPIEVEAGQSWQTTLELPANDNALIPEARLYRLDAPETPYRQVVLWLP